MPQPSSSQVASYRVLARQYRPQRLSELIGQNLLVKTLSHGIERNRLPHAFLFHGIRGVGKTTTARILAKALNCLGADGQGLPTPDPCGVCTSCVAILEDRHLDVVEMDAASRTGVDDVREVIEAARYKAVNGRYKIYIVDEVHMLSKSAFNALLKTLEEPPPHVKFIFATTEIRKVPETVLSRCMRFDLGRIDPPTLLSHFSTIMAKEGLSIEEEGLSLIVRAADGSVRDGLSLLDQAIALSGDSVTAETVRNMLGLVDRGLIFVLLTALLRGHIPEVLAHVKDIYRRGGDPVMLMEDILELVYWLTCLKTAPQLQSDVTWPESDRRQGAEIIKNLPLPSLMRIWQVLHKGYEEVARSPLPSQAVEMVLVRAGYLSDLPHAEALLAAIQGNPRSLPSLALATSQPTPAPSVILKPSGEAPTQEEPKVSITGTFKDQGPLMPSLPASFSELLDKVREAKEPLLYSNMLHDIHLVSYAPGALVIRLGDMAEKTLPGRLRQVVEQLTGQPWVVDVVTEGGAPTLAQEKKAVQEAQMKVSLGHPLVQAVVEKFPGSTVTAK